MRSNKKAEGYHLPVLCEEAVDALKVGAIGNYVDATFGGGGHSREILKRLGKGRLLAFDQDEAVRQNVPDDDRFVLINENFRYLYRFLRVKDMLPVSGILADLGVSSYQFDTASRGFSIRMDAPLDMRMDRRQEQTAADILKKYEMKDLWKLFEKYGEVRNARSLAMHLVERRKQFPLETVGELKNIIIPLVKGNERRYQAQVFQALRIEVNDEMNALESFLEQAAQALEPKGRLVVITFHSVEDRMVKRFFKKKENEEENILRSVFKKPQLPSKEEIGENHRAAGAKMRVAEKIKNH